MFVLLDESNTNNKVNDISQKYLLRRSIFKNSYEIEVKSNNNL